jgi:hypothetical protein
VETLLQEPERAGSPAEHAGANGTVPPADASQNGHGGHGGDPAQAPARQCEQCGAAMVAVQDWCLECGTAAPGRLGMRPGWRAAATVVGLTLLLVGGAVAASYAALTQDANQQAAAPAPPAATPVPQQQAQTPAPVTPAPAVTPPSVTTPTTSIPSTSPLVPPTTQTPTIPTIPPVSAPTTSTPVTVTPTRPTTTPTTPTQVTPNPGNGGSKNTPTPPQAITLTADAAAPYNPYGRATDPGDPALAHDGDVQTSWKIVTPADGKEMQVGLVVDLGTVQHVSALELQTDTPGFRMEVYGSDASELPADVLDTRWTHVASRSKVDRNSTGTNKPNDGKERIVLPKNGDKFRRVLLWFTTPPDNATVRIAELKLFG